MVNGPPRLSRERARCVIDQDLAHRARRKRKKMDAVDGCGLRHRMQFQVDLVHERGRIQGHRAARCTALAARDTAQFLIDQGEQRVGRRGRSGVDGVGHNPAIAEFGELRCIPALSMAEYRSLRALRQAHLALSADRHHLALSRNHLNRTMTAASHVFDATEANFETDVIQASLTTPVLVDFWAAWCAPCKTLGPILESVVASYNGAVKLAKVDTDAQGQLAAVFGIRSLPTVVLVKDGQMIDGFMGALPESGVREFLQRHNIVANAANAENDTPAPAAAAVAETPEQTIARLQQEIAAAPDKGELKLDLAFAYLRAGLADAAQTELDALPANLTEDAKAKRLRNQLEFARAFKDAPDVTTLRARLAQDANDHAARDLLGVRLLLDGDTAAALDEFLHILRTQRNWNEGQAKKRLIAAFNILDDEDLVGTYRRKMASLLF